MQIDPEQVRWIAAGLADGSVIRFGRSDKPGESSISDELAAATLAGFRPSAALPPIQPPPPPPPPITRLVAPVAMKRGDGRRIVSGSTLQNLHVEGFAQNIVIAGGDPTATTTLVNVRTIRAYRDTPADRFEGQGLYIERNTGPVVIRGCLFGFNGAQDDKPPAAWSTFRHGVYHQMDAGPVTVEDSIFVGNAAAGFQTRSGATLRRCVFLDNAIAVQAVRGGAILEDCVIYDGHHWYSPEDKARKKPATWAGNIAILATCDVTARNVLIAGRENQGRPLRQQLAAHDLGCLKGDSVWDGKPVPAFRWDLESVIVAGWPHHVFTGDRLPTSVEGVTIKAQPLSYDWRPVIDAILAERMTVTEGRAILAAEIRQAVGVP